MNRALATAGLLCLFAVIAVSAAYALARFASADEYVVIEHHTWAVEERLSCHPYHAPRTADAVPVAEGEVLAVVRTDDRMDHRCHRVWLPDGTRAWVLESATGPAEIAAN